MKDLEREILGTIFKHRLIQPGSRVLVGVSGGSDSLGLLYILKALQTHLKCSLAVAHLDHQLRKSSAEEAQFVRDKAGLLQLPFYFTAVDVKSLAEAAGKSLEETAREVRYQFFEQTAGSIAADKIAVAHTKDDQAETLLLHLTRGAGMDGLEAMSLMRTLRKFDLIRPFLLTEKSCVKEYLQNLQVKWLEDASNHSLAFKRNKIRNVLIPMIQKELNPRIVESLSRLSHILEDENAYLTKQTQEVLERMIRRHRSMVSLPVEEFQKLEIPLQRRLIRELFRLFYPYQGLAFTHVENVIFLVNESQSGRKIAVGHGLSAWKEAGMLIFGQYRKMEKIEPEILNIPGEKVISGQGVKLKISLNIRPRDDLMDVSKSSFPFGEIWSSLQAGKTFHFCEYFDAGKINSPILVRTRTLGDRYDPIGFGKLKKLKDIYVDEKIPLRYRSQVPVFVSEEKIFWVAGYRVSESFKVSDATNQVLEVKLQLEGMSL